MDTIPKNVVDSAAALAACNQSSNLAPEGFVGKPVLLVPDGYTVKTPDGWEPEKPSRVIQTFRTPNVNSFVVYVNDHKVDPVVPMIYVDASDTGASIVGVIDAHDGGLDPDWQSHRAVLIPKTTTEWNRWVGVNGKQFSQVEFAQFVENNVLDILTPTGADLLTICNEFEIEGTLQFQKIQRLQDGNVRFTYNDSKSATARGVAIPELFTLRLRVFEGTQPVAVAARFRYRLKQGGELVLWFELVNPHLQVRAAIDGIVDIIKAAAIGTVLYGTI
jgi:uncharacterized protein YfdQ (DUF2303 family)